MSATLSSQDWMLVAEHLAVISHTSVPFPKALRQTASEFHKAKTRTALETLAADLDKNPSLADALRRHPELFPPACAALLAAAEKNATPQEALADLTQIAKIESGQNRANFDSLNYDFTFIFVAAIFIFSVLWLVLLPAIHKISAMFSDLAEGREGIPWLTEQVLFLATYVMPGIFASAISLAIFFLYWRFSRFIFRLPMGHDPIARTFALGNWARWVGSALKQNLSLVEGLRLTRTAMQSQSLSRATAAVEEKLQRGQAFCEALTQQTILSPLVGLGLEPSLTLPQLSSRLVQIAALLQHQAELSLALTRTKQSWPFTLFWFFIVVTIAFFGLAVLGLFLPFMKIISTLQR